MTHTDTKMYAGESRGQLVNPRLDVGRMHERTRAPTDKKTESKLWMKLKSENIEIGNECDPIWWCVPNVSRNKANWKNPFQFCRIEIRSKHCDCVNERRTDADRRVEDHWSYQNINFLPLTVFCMCQDVRRPGRCRDYTLNKEAKKKEGRKKCL